MPEPTTTAAVTFAATAAAVPVLTAFGVPLGLRADVLLARCIDQFGSMFCDGPWPTSYPIHPEVRKAGRA